jgi:hypothetical protein
MTPNASRVTARDASSRSAFVPEREAGVPSDPAPHPRRGWIRLAATAGGEIVISVLVALVFFAVFMVGLSVIMPSGLTLNEVVQPTSDDEQRGNSNLTASFIGLRDLSDRLSPTAAVLTVLNTSVMRKAADAIAWGPVASGTPLREGDAVQTTREGRALITFKQGKRLQLEQNSLMIVRGARESLAEEDPTPTVHVLVGELWGNVARDSANRPVVNITSPGAVTHVSPANGAGTAQFRFAVGSDKTSVLSMYRGSAEIVTRGRTIRVGANQYVSVDSARGVAPPAPLPDAPTLLAPESGATFSYRELAPQVTFRWNAVAGAEGYRLLVAREPSFQAMLVDQRVVGTSFAYGNFHNGPYYWRVSALRAGAEGPPSQPRAVFITNIQAAPTLQLELPPDVVNGDACTIRGVTVAGTRIVVAGQDVPPDAAGRFERTVPLKRGFNVIVIEAIDRVGNTTYKSKVVEAKF